MKSVKIYLSLLLGCLLLCFNSCTKSSVEHWIDNPTDKEIVVTIDGTNHTIPAKSGINYPFEYGKHTLAYDGSSVNFMVKPSQTTGFINPTQSNYIFFKNVYVNESDDRATDEYMAWLKKQVLSDTEVIINDSLQTLPLPFKVINDLFIEKADNNWDYYLDENIPTSVVLRDAIVTRRNRSLASDANYQAGKFQTVKSKLFRESDFLSYLKESGVEDNMSFPVTKIKLEDLPKTKMPEIDVNKIACDPGREAVKNALEHWNKWLTLDGSDFANEYNNNIGVMWQKILPQTLESECYDNYNKDYTYKQAASEINSVLNKLSYANFFVY